MKVAFLHAGADQDTRFADLMVASVRRHMPHVEVLQLTDQTTPAVAGCTPVRMPWDGQQPMLFKMNHLSRLVGDVLALDTDVIVRADLSPVFALPFDVGLTWRDGPIRGPNGEDIAKLMPFNCGVMFCRNPIFWQACVQWVRQTGCDHWCADQLAVAHIAREFNVLRLHCSNFNHTPRNRDEDVTRRLAVHYKGDRKEWMIP